MEHIENVEHGVALLYEIIATNRNAISMDAWRNFQEIARKVVDLASRIYINDIRAGANKLAESIESEDAAPQNADKWLSIQRDVRDLAEILEARGFIRDTVFEW